MALLALALAAHAPIIRARASHARLLCAGAEASWPLVTSPSNARLKLLRKLHARRQREKHGLVLLEGHRLVLDAVAAGLEPEFVVLHDGARTSEVDAALRPLGPERVLRAPAELVASLSDTETPQGILAAVPLRARPLPAAPTLVLVCDGVSDPGNLGTLLRSAAGAGVGACLLTPGCCDPMGLKALRAGMGAQFRLPVHGAESWEAIATDLASWGCQTFAADAGGALAHFDVDWCAPAALVVGSEAHGLSETVRADPRVTTCSIPADGVESLNAAVAGSVILFEARRQRSVAL